MDKNACSRREEPEQIRFSRIERLFDEAVDLLVDMTDEGQKQMAALVDQLDREIEAI